MKKYATTIIISLSLPIGEIHSYWNDNGTIQNWIIWAYKPMVISWNIKFVSIQLSVSMYFLAWLYWQRNRINETTVFSFFLFSILDTIMYFCNYKIAFFGATYMLFLLIWFLCYRKRNIKIPK